MVNHLPLERGLAVKREPQTASLTASSLPALSYLTTHLD